MGIVSLSHIVSDDGEEKFIGIFKFFKIIFCQIVFLYVDKVKKIKYYSFTGLFLSIAEGELSNDPI